MKTLFGFLGPAFYTAATVVNALWFYNRLAWSTPTQLTAAITGAVLFWIGVGFHCLHAPTAPVRKRRFRTALWLSLTYYLAILACILFFGGLFLFTRSTGGKINTIPFRTIRSYLWSYEQYGNFSSVANIGGNLILFMPMGALLPLLCRPLRKPWFFLPLLGVLVAGVEYMQWYTRTGSADIDDFLLNCTGAIVAYLCTLLAIGVAHLWRKMKNRKKI